MGLLLSILVACVGVIELITFSSNVRRNLTLRPVRGDLATVRENYIDELHNLRRRIADDLQKIQSKCHSNVYQIDISRDLQRYLPTLRLNSHEDIDIEFNEHVLSTPGLIRPRNFLVTEKTDNCVRRTPSPRRYVVSEEPQEPQESKQNHALPEYLIEEQENSSKSPNHPRYVLREEGKRPVPIPLSSQFVVTERDQTNSNEFCTNIDHELHDLTSSFSQQNSLYCNEEHKRPPSPYPVLEVPHASRNNIVNDLVNDPVVSIGEVDEDFYSSRSPSPYEVSKVILKDVPPNLKLFSEIIEKKSIHNTILKLSRSKSESEKNDFTTPTQVPTHIVSNDQVGDKDEEDESFSSFEVLELVDSEENVAGNQEYLDSLDGVRKQKCTTRNKKSLKKKYSANNSLEEPSSSSRENVDEAKGAEVSIDSARELEEVQRNLKTVSSRNEERQLPEPFWVKH